LFISEEIHKFSQSILFKGFLCKKSTILLLEKAQSK